MISYAVVRVNLRPDSVVTRVTNFDYLASLNYSHCSFRRDRDYHATGTARGGGCLILVRNGIRADRIHHFEPDLNSVEDLWIRIDLSSTSLYICTVYITPTIGHARYIDHFQDISNAIEGMESDSKLVIVGDFNLRRITWLGPSSGVEPAVRKFDDSVNALFDLHRVQIRMESDSKLIIVGDFNLPRITWLGSSRVAQVFATVKKNATPEFEKYHIINKKKVPQ